MTSTAWVTLTFVSITLGYLTLIQGQMTELDKGTCTYSFVIPQTDLISTCKSYSSQQVETLQKKIENLQDKVDNLSGRQRRNSSRPNQEAFSCACNNSTSFEFAYSDCDDVKVLGDGVSGIYQIDPINSTGALIEVHEVKNGSKNGRKKASTQKYWVVETWGAVNVYCDLENEDVGWTVLMRRTKMDVSFDRDWSDFKWGFGNKEDGDFWLGLEHMYRITNQLKKKYSLWIVIVDDKKIPHIFPYGEFKIDNEATNYTVTVDNYHGQGINRFVSGRQFNSRDHGPTYNCAPEKRGHPTSGGGWWFTTGSTYYYSCRSYVQINLNAPKPYNAGFSGITSVVMKIKPFEK